MSDEIRLLLLQREFVSRRVIHGANYVTHRSSVVEEQEQISRVLSEIAEKLPKLGYRDRFTIPEGDARICSSCGDATDVYGQCCTKCQGELDG
jgi:hypothetical protein